MVKLPQDYLTPSQELRLSYCLSCNTKMPVMKMANWKSHLRETHPSWDTLYQSEFPVDCFHEAPLILPSR